MDTEGSRLKEIRTKMNLSQQSFGDLFNLSKQYVSNMENGGKPVNRELLVSLLVDHKVNANYILAGIGEPFITPEFEGDFKKQIMQEVEGMLTAKGYFTGKKG